MSTDCYRIAYDRAASEITAIDAEIQTLVRRKELLEDLLKPLQLLLNQSESAAVPVPFGNGSASEFPIEAAAQDAPVVVLLESRVVESGPFEAAAFTQQPETEKAVAHGEGNGRSISHEDLAGLAYRFWNDRGQTHGYHEEDWTRAARELQSTAS